MGWFARSRSSTEPTHLWTRCQRCDEAIYHKDLVKSLFVCPRCDHHFRLSLEGRINLILDEGSFVEADSQLSTADPLRFEGHVPYRDRIRNAKQKAKSQEAITTGTGTLDQIPVALGVFNFAFMGGSMGSVVGEKIVRLVDTAIERRLPLIIVSCSGGARMDEGIFSLMQMVKTSQAIARMSRARLPYISFLTDPTTGGVTASFAMLGDIIMAEPGALIGFAGPRVIEQTIQQKLPEGFQKAEFLLEAGVIDMVVHRREVKTTLAKLLRFFSAS